MTAMPCDETEPTVSMAVRGGAKRGAAGNDTNAVAPVIAFIDGMRCGTGGSGFRQDVMGKP